ncbi:uncharacterized protein tmem222b isoform 1-T1 [Pholidichthys leucotaenia]
MAEDVEKESMKNYHIASEKINPEASRYPYCIVWTPIPVLSWLLPFIGHMGICTSTGIIRDFAGPYFVSEDNMAFGRPTKYWMLDVSKVYTSGSNAWDTAVHDASEEYKHRMHLMEHGQPLSPCSYPWKTRQLCRLPEDLAAFPDAHGHHSHNSTGHQPAVTWEGTAEPLPQLGRGADLLNNKEEWGITRRQANVTELMKTSHFQEKIVGP